MSAPNVESLAGSQEVGSHRRTNAGVKKKGLAREGSIVRGTP